jgi:hypothetical protein
MLKYERRTKSFSADLPVVATASIPLAADPPSSWSTASLEGGVSTLAIDEDSGMEDTV